ncbi:outer membrane beta-barrel protein [Carboxylicivirga sp. RSCT41]|uniref:outer membrane beta-barrel protein n=1 Tax=Carboxylicivirga agarovorans TaxID=3417570 RepID=UPI003D340E76
MRKQLVIALITISFIKSYSQISFENGYFIDESNKKIECLIKNIDWLDNPTEFMYKLSPNEEVQKATIHTVKEFVINDFCKYIRANTKIDRSIDHIDKIGFERNSTSKEELLFLKVLIEGRASLFLYEEGELSRLFYNLDDSEINQLVYKQYIHEGKIKENNLFKQQLYLNLKCEEIGLNDIERLKYSKGNLIKLFVKYNECAGSNFINYAESKQKNDLFNLTFRPGLNYNSLDIQNSLLPTIKPDFGNNIGVRVGFEAEFILPFNMNKWAIIIEPTYQSFKEEQPTEVPEHKVLKSKINYNSIELPIGLRHYFFLNDKSKLFVNASFYAYDIQINSSISLLRSDDYPTKEVEIESSRNFALGAGYKLKDKYSLEIRYNSNRDILSKYNYWSSNYSSLYVILGLSLF